MSVQLGIAIGAGDMRVVAIADAQQVVFSARRVAQEGDNLQDVLREVLREARSACPAAQRVSASMAAGIMPVKKVPSTFAGDATQRRPLQPAPTDGLFLDASSSSLRTRGRVLPDGDVVIGTLAQPYVRLLVEVTRELRMRLAGVVPAAVALAHFSRSAPIIQDEGGLRLSVEANDGLLTRLRLCRISAADSSPAPLHGTIRVCSDIPASWADAIGCIGAVERAWCVLTPHDMGVPRPFARLRQRLAGATLALSVLALVVVPPVVASGRIRQQERYLNAVKFASVRLAEEDAHQLSFEQDLASLRDFDAARPSWVPRMAALAAAIPPSVFVISLRADSADIELTIVGRDVGAIPEQIARLTPFRNVELIGAITHELVNGEQLQRVTVRCRTTAAPSSPTVAAPSGELVSAPGGRP